MWHASCCSWDGWVAALTTSALKVGAKSLAGWNDLPEAAPRQAAA